MKALMGAGGFGEFGDPDMCAYAIVSSGALKIRGNRGFVGVEMSCIRD